ncbi:type IV pilus assembly protein PilM [Marisediminicola senii]|uniref:type IV pilus assembly protein PilM n=1 Tax=Marisediminicola senii TaxID=2711233 RepID=UPI0013EDBE50|nr:type IV pilus assembly protein PilM [Marisediminicola senii]
MTSTIVGIDIGSVGVRAVEIKNAAKAAPTVVRYHEVPLPDGSVRRGEVLDVQAVSGAIKQLWAMGGFSSKDVVLGMGGPRVLSRDLTMPKAPLKQLKEALPFHVQDMLPVPVADTLLDFYPIAEVETPTGQAVRGLLVAVIKDAVNANIDAVTQAGLRPVQVDLIPFALTRAIAPSSLLGLSAMVSVGANTTNVVVVRDGVPQFVRIIAAGGDDITRALVSQLGLDAPEAERQKRGIGLDGQTLDGMHGGATTVINSTAGELLTSIRNTLSYFVNTTPGSVIERVVLSGGGSQLRGFAAGLREVTRLPVDRAESIGTARLSKELEKSLADDHRFALTTAFGLALGSHT